MKTVILLTLGPIEPTLRQLFPAPEHGVPLDWGR